MKEAAATEVKNKFGQILETVVSEPVTIEKKGRPVAVIVSISEYQRLTELEDRYWGERAQRALEGGLLSEDDTKNWLRGKLDAKVAGE